MTRANMAATAATAACLAVATATASAAGQVKVPQRLNLYSVHANCPIKWHMSKDQQSDDKRRHALREMQSELKLEPHKTLLT